MCILKAGLRSNHDYKTGHSMATPVVPEFLSLPLPPDSGGAHDYKNLLGGLKTLRVRKTVNKNMSKHLKQTAMSTANICRHAKTTQSTT